MGAVFAGLLNFPHGTSWSMGNFLGQSPSLVWGHTMASLTFEGQAPAEAFGVKVAAGLGASGEAGHGGLPHWVMFVVSGVIALAGVGLAYHFHLRDRAALGRLSARLPQLVRVLEAKYWVDEIYDRLFVKPLWLLARIAEVFDMIVNALVFVVAYVPKVGAYGVSLATQRGLVQGYAVVMLIGVAVILLLVFR
jgi:NADH:ubiquinone oxidoreductase subunit 5 (subunit L)/multisubunit Na+/H+ antiporter MnhA subunit